MKLHATSLALALASSGVFAGDVITINPDGIVGGDAPISVGSLGWNNGNAISQNFPTGPDTNVLSQTYGQGGLANFNNAQGNPIGGLGLNSSYQWTYVFGFQESVSTVSAGGATLASFQVTNGGDNFFKIYYNGPSGGGVVQNNLNGTGFTAGTLILSGSIQAYNPVDGSGAGTFTSTGLSAGLLDQANGGDNYNGLLSTIGVGSTKFTGVVQVGAADANFFGVLPQELNILLDTFNSQPFTHADPSSCFTDGAGNPVNGAGPNNAGGACANSIGLINGLSGPDVQFETRATNDFKIPEPASMTLVFTGLLSMLGLRKRR